MPVLESSEVMERARLSSRVLVHQSSKAKIIHVDSFTQVATFDIVIGAFSWMCYVVYVSPSPMHREALGVYLFQLRASISKPWMTVEDFNEIM